MVEIKSVQMQMCEATARANAAAAKCEKLSELLEYRLHQVDNEEVASLYRLDAQDDAIIELAEIVAEVSADG